MVVVFLKLLQLPKLTITIKTLIIFTQVQMEVWFLNVLLLVLRLLQTPVIQGLNLEKC